MLQSHQNNRTDDSADGVPVVVGYFFVYAMRLPASSARDAYIEGQIIEHGQLVK